MFKGLCLLPIVLLCLAPLKAQEPKPLPTQKPPVEVDIVRVNTELVQTDVMVFDKDGRFVNGLKQEQFELLVDGKPQPISFFESVVMGGRREGAALRASRGDKRAELPVADTGEEATSERGRSILFFINDLHLDPGSLARTHKVINNFIDKQLGPNDQAAITSSSGQIGFLQQLTNNPAVLRAALERLKFIPGAVRDNDRPAMSDYSAYLIAERNDRQLFDYYVQETVRVMHVDPAMASSIVTSRAQRIIRQSDVVVKTSLSSLVNLMAATAKWPGRKLVFFISDGLFPTSPAQTSLP